MLKYTLSFKNCAFYLYRGACAFEKLFGQRYNLDITFYTKCTYGSFINYFVLYNFVYKFVHRLHFEYIEEMCYLLSVALLRKYASLFCVEVAVLKPNVLIGGKLDGVWSVIQVCK
ncbi:MAG: dihydroneopterin aldolase [Candidatus Hodgkinia cicadicola]